MTRITLIVELVDERNEPVPPGTPSAKVLLTNLYNRAQPLSRYELTDRFVAQPPAPDHGHLRAAVEGRSDEGDAGCSARAWSLTPWRASPRST